MCVDNMYFRMFFTLLQTYTVTVYTRVATGSAWNQKMYTESESETLCVTHKDRTARSLGGATGGV